MQPLRSRVGNDKLQLPAFSPLLGFGMTRFHLDRVHELVRSPTRLAFAYATETRLHDPSQPRLYSVKQRLHLLGDIQSWKACSVHCRL